MFCIPNLTLAEAINDFENWMVERTASAVLTSHNARTRLQAHQRKELALCEANNNLWE